MSSPKITDHDILDVPRGELPKITILIPTSIMQIYHLKDTKETLEYGSDEPIVNILSEIEKDPNYLCLHVGKNDTLCYFRLHGREKEIRDDQEFLEKLKVGLKFIEWLHDNGTYETYIRTLQCTTQTLSDFTTEIDTIKKEITL